MYYISFTWTTVFPSGCEFPQAGEETREEELSLVTDSVHLLCTAQATGKRGTGSTTSRPQVLKNPYVCSPPGQGFRGNNPIHTTLQHSSYCALQQPLYMYF